MEFFTKLLSTADFMPHGMCYQWQPSVLWMHVVSDLIIAIAYYSIPLALSIVVYRRGQFPFKWVLGLFALFILLCGTTHLVGIVIVWDPIYRLQGLLKLLTAGISIATAIVLFPLLPQILGSIDTLERRSRARATT